MIPAACAGDVVSRLFHSSQSGTKIGIVTGGPLLHLGKSWERDARVKIFSKLKIVVEIRTDQHGKIEPGVQKSELGFEHLPAALLHLQLRLDDVGMRDFPALLEILR